MMRERKLDVRKPQYVRKNELITQLRQSAERATGSVLVEYRGMTVKDTTELRSRLRKISAEMEIAKNTLLKRAVDEANISGLDPFLQGPTAVVFAYEDSVAAVKTLSTYARENRNLILKGGYLEGRVYDGDRLRDIAAMPPREQIIAQFLGALQGPAANLVGMLQAPVAQLVFTLQAIAEKGGGGEEAAAA